MQDVSHETLLQRYVNLLLEANKTLTLIGKSTIPNIWERHIQDSLQLCPLLDKTKVVADIGTGGGMPGIVLACCGFKVVLIEKSPKKVIFLKKVLRELNLDATIAEGRMETLDLQDVPIFVSRATMSLGDLLQNLYTQNKSAQGIFLKGKTWQQELEVTQLQWSFQFELFKSQTSENSRIIKVSEIAPRT